MESFKYINNYTHYLKVEAVKIVLKLDMLVFKILQVNLITKNGHLWFHRLDDWPLRIAGGRRRLAVESAGRTVRRRSMNSAGKSKLCICSFFCLFQNMIKILTLLFVLIRLD